MRKARMWSGLLVLAAMGALNGNVGAAAIDTEITYSTSGTIGQSNIDGTPAIEFVGKDRAIFYDVDSGGGPLTPSGPRTPVGSWHFSLGDFHFSRPPSGTTTRYDQTPFTINLHIDGVEPQTFTLPGTFSGTFDDTDGLKFTEFGFVQGSDLPMIDQSFTFRAGDLIHSVWVAHPGGSRDPSDGDFSLLGYIEARTVPEPTTLALLAPFAAWILLRRRRHRYAAV